MLVLVTAGAIALASEAIEEICLHDVMVKAEDMG
jgi:hypothetical protein